ncbi:hypothetical protein EHF_0099 [Ehrlichia japonica]|uniref:Uncharacterized protein n=1 Tax=Ehrlichia japonica TaxID=391036 RepID=X5H4H3_9RICK|nr:hypothetical protein EHF_0099 [Ehrlichia japonica]
MKHFAYLLVEIIKLDIIEIIEDAHTSTDKFTCITNDVSKTLSTSVMKNFDIGSLSKITNIDKSPDIAKADIPNNNHLRHNFIL